MFAVVRRSGSLLALSADDSLVLGLCSLLLVVLSIRLASELGRGCSTFGGSLFFDLVFLYLIIAIIV